MGPMPSLSLRPTHATTQRAIGRKRRLVHFLRDNDPDGAHRASQKKVAKAAVHLSSKSRRWNASMSASCRSPLCACKRAVGSGWHARGEKKAPSIIRSLWQNSQQRDEAEKGGVPPLLRRTSKAVHAAAARGAGFLRCGSRLGHSAHNPLGHGARNKHGGHGRVSPCEGTACAWECWEHRAAESVRSRRTAHALLPNAATNGACAHGPCRRCSGVLMSRTCTVRRISAMAALSVGRGPRR
eukprot:6191524-Pleurochrysis_carterae.AAC.3